MKCQYCLLSRIRTRILFSPSFEKFVYCYLEKEPGRIFRLHRQVLFRLASLIWKSLSNPTRETSSLCLVGFASPYSRDAQFLAIAYATQAH